MQNEFLILMTSLVKAVQQIADNSNTMLIRQDELNKYLISVLPAKNIAAEKVMDRRAVEKYLNISPSTFRKKLLQGKLIPHPSAGGDRFYESELIGEYNESRRRGRI